jgi:hypothetical protein
MGGRQTALVTASLLLGVLSGAMTLARSPQLVSFAPLAQATVQAWSAHPAGPGEMNLRQFGGSPQLVKAVLPQRPVQSAHTAKPVRSNARKRSFRRPYAQSQQAWVVLAAWSDAETPPHLLFAVARRSRISYAAVPIANGWLIVQI